MIEGGAPVIESRKTLDLVPALREDWRAPHHLAEWCGIVDSVLDGGVRGMASVCFQHYKSSTTLVGIVRALRIQPERHVILLTHSHDKAQAMGKDLRQLWKSAGGTTRKGFDTIDDWQTPEMGGCVVMSASQSKLGYPCDILFCDDPLDETEYMLASVRDEVDKAITLYTARAASHLNSVLIDASRWHQDDPIGRRLKRQAVQWRYFCYPGIIDYGQPTERAFAPEVMTLEQHKAMRAEWAEQDPSLRTWWAQVQNEPLPDALGFFVGEHPYVGPVKLDRVVFGVDAAFSAGKKSDYFACVGMADLGGNPDRFVVFDVVRHQRGLSSAIDTLRSKKAVYPNARFVSYVSGPEVGIYQHLFETGQLDVERMPARWNKAVRAQKAALAWRNGEIVVQMGKPWSGPFVAELHGFDGREDGVDDQTDGLVASYDAIRAGRPVPGFSTQFTFGKAAV